MRGRTAPQLAVVTTLLSILGHLDQLDEAEGIRAELLRIQPDITCAFIRETSLFIDPGYLDRYIDGLRKAGLAE